MSSVVERLTVVRPSQTRRAAAPGKRIHETKPSLEEIAFDLIERIYEAAEEPRLWTDFLERLARALQSAVAVMAHEDFRACYPSGIRRATLDGALSAAYEQHVSFRNASADGERSGSRPGEVVTSQVMPSFRSPVEEPSDDLPRRFNVEHLLGAILFGEHGRMSTVSVLRPGSDGPFGDAEAALLRRLIPHLQRSLEIQGGLARKRCERTAALEILDGIPVGVVLLDGRGKALFFNRAASEMFAAKDGIVLGPQGLTAATREDAGALRRLISDAAGESGMPGPPAGRVLAVSRPSLRRSYCVHVKPVQATEPSPGANHPAVAVFLTDPDRRTKPDGGVLRNLYGFTPAESRVAAELMQGGSVEEAARLDVSLNTARTHVKRLFEKTDTHTHRELVRLLLCSSCCSGVSQSPRNAHHAPIPLPVWRLQAAPKGFAPVAS